MQLSTWMLCNTQQFIGPSTIHTYEYVYIYIYSIHIYIYYFHKFRNQKYIFFRYIMYSNEVLIYSSIIRYICLCIHVYLFTRHISYTDTVSLRLAQWLEIGENHFQLFFSRRADCLWLQKNDFWWCNMARGRKTPFMYQL